MDVVETVQRGRYFVVVRPEGSEFVNVTDLDGRTPANKFFAIFLLHTAQEPPLVEPRESLIESRGTSREIEWYGNSGSSCKGEGCT